MCVFLELYIKDYNDLKGDRLMKLSNTYSEWHTTYTSPWTLLHRSPTIHLWITVLTGPGWGGQGVNSFTRREMCVHHVSTWSLPSHDKYMSRNRSLRSAWRCCVKLHWEYGMENIVGAIKGIQGYVCVTQVLLLYSMAAECFGSIRLKGSLYFEC